MKKIIIFFILLFICPSIIAKEILTNEQRVQNSCAKKILQYNSNPNVDNEITVTECMYNYSKAYKLDIMPLAKNLFYLYANKYQNSAENKEYFDKMYKYGMNALKAGSKDVDLTVLMVYQAAIKKNLIDIDYTYEKLCEVSPQKANEMKESIVQAKNNIQKENEQGWQNLTNTVVKAAAAAIPGNEPQLPANYHNCYNTKTWIKENYDGKIIVTPEYIIEISNYDSFTSRYWMKMENILILDNGFLINTDNGEKVEIKNITHR